MTVICHFLRLFVPSSMAPFHHFFDVLQEYFDRDLKLAGSCLRVAPTLTVRIVVNLKFNFELR